MVGARKKLAPAVGVSPALRCELLARAEATLAAPPASPFTERHPGRGCLVVRFVLPLELAAPLNRSRHATGWQAAKQRAAVYEAMRGQGWRFGRTLPGRPMVRAVRFSSVEPDVTAAWFKVAVDVLLPSRLRRGKVVAGLGLLEDDRPSKLEVRSWWERVPSRQGFALIEVFSGGAES